MIVYICILFINILNAKLLYATLVLNSLPTTHVHYPPKLSASGNMDNLADTLVG